MNLHEYQSKQIFAEYAIPIPQGEVAGSTRGGRGNAGGVRVARDPDARPTARRLK
jgi:succinyl-CoA synthetase beta subunit